MKYKKHKWMIYGNRGKIIEIKIKDESDRPIDTFKCNNPKAFKSIAKIIRDKYGFDFSEEGKREQQKSQEDAIKEEISWLNSQR